MAVSPQYLDRAKKRPAAAHTTLGTADLHLLHQRVQRLTGKSLPPPPGDTLHTLRAIVADPIGFAAKLQGSGKGPRKPPSFPPDGDVGDYENALQNGGGRLQRRMAQAPPSDPYLAGGLRFKKQAFIDSNNAGVAVPTIDGGFVPLGQAVGQVQRRFGPKALAFTKSQSQVETEPERRIAQEEAHRAHTNYVGRSIDAWKRGDPSPAATIGYGLMQGGLDRLYEGAGHAADVVSSGQQQATLNRARTKEGARLTPGQNSNYMAEYGKRAIAAVGNGAGLAAWAGRAGTAGEALGHALSGRAFGADAALSGTRDLSVLSDPTSSDEEKAQAWNSLGTSAAMFGLPAFAKFVGGSNGSRGMAGANPHEPHGTSNPLHDVHKGDGTGRAHSPEHDAVPRGGAGSGAPVPVVEGSVGGHSEGLPAAYRRGDPGRLGPLLGFDAPNHHGLHEPTPTEVAKAQAEKYTPTTYAELHSASGADLFHRAISEGKASQGAAGGKVTVYGPDDYRGMRLFLSEDGKTGFALKGDDIVSVFKHADSPVRSATRSILRLATEQGGRRLDAFDTILPDLYSKDGFRAVARLPWSDEYAPKGWDYDAAARFNGGRPDVVFMAKDPNAGPYQPGDGPYVASYEEGVVAQNRALRGDGRTPGAGSFLPSLGLGTTLATSRRFPPRPAADPNREVRLRAQIAHADQMLHALASGRAGQSAKDASYYRDVIRQSRQALIDSQR